MGAGLRPLTRAHRPIVLLVAHGIMSQVAAAAGDDADLAPEPAPGEAGGNAVVEGGAAGRENDRSLAREEAFAGDILGRSDDRIEKGVHRRGLGEDTLETFDAAQGQALAARGVRDL